MARLHKHPGKLGTKDGITVYEMRGKVFIRTASNLTAERVKTDPAFKKTMANSALLGKASRISSPIYAAMKKNHPRRKATIRDITSWVYGFLKSGHQEEEIMELAKREWL